MRSTSTVKWIAALSVAVMPAVMPSPARAHDETKSSTTTTSTTTSCAETCTQPCDVPCAKPQGQQTTGETLDQTTGEASSVNDPEHARALEQARAEERRRIEADMQQHRQMRDQQYQAELDRARADERAQVQSDLEKQQQATARARSAERASTGQPPSSGEGRFGKALVTPFGAWLQAGGGVTNFTQSAVKDATTVGGAWDVRVGVGSRSILAGEAAYLGSAQQVSGPSTDRPYVVGNGLEGNLRLNAPITQKAFGLPFPVLLEPFAIAGLGWKHYSVSNQENAAVAIAKNDDIMTVPVGAGLAVGAFGLTLDGRFTYRQAIGSDLLGTPVSSFDSTSLNSWTAGGSLGFEF